MKQKAFPIFTLKAPAIRRSMELLFLSLALLACSAEPEPLFRVASNVWPGYESLYLARALGLYDDTPIRLVEMTSASQVSHAIRNGAVEAAALTLDETVGLLQDRDMDLRVVLVMDVSNGADALLARDGIDNLAALAGKRVGVENTATGAVVLDAALQSAGLRSDSPRIIPMTVNMHRAAWRNHEVDALVTFEPVRGQVLNDGGHILFDSSQIPGRILDVLVVRNEALRKHPNTLRTLISGYFTALRHVRENPKHAAELMAPRLAVSAEQVMPQFEGLKLPDLAENRAWLSGTDPLLTKSAAGLVRLMRDHSLLRRDVDLHLLADAAFLPEPPP